LATAQNEARWRTGAKGDGGLAAAERALALDANLADARAVRARILYEDGHFDEADTEIAIALRLDPESWEVNAEAARLRFLEHRLEEAARHYEKATALMETDFGSPGMLVTTYTAMGDRPAAKRAAQIAVVRAEKAIAQDRSNGAAMSFGVSGLAVLGEAERIKEWINRGLLVDPDNNNMIYNFACTLAAQLKDTDAALDLLDRFMVRATRGMLNHNKIDPDLESVRDHPRYKAMLAAAEARLNAAEGKGSSSAV
jgi:adenylate cyclase